MENTDCDVICVSTTQHRLKQSRLHFSSPVSSHSPGNNSRKRKLDENTNIHSTKVLRCCDDASTVISTEPEPVSINIDEKCVKKDIDINTDIENVTDSQETNLATETRKHEYPENDEPAFSREGSPSFEQVAESSCTPTSEHLLGFQTEGSEELISVTQHEDSKMETEVESTVDSTCTTPTLQKSHTPRQLLKKQVSDAKRKEKERLKQEKEEERIKRKEEKLAKKVEKENQKKQEKEEREKKKQEDLMKKMEKENQRKHDKEEKEKKRQVELAAKNEEKRIKEEQRLAKEEQEKKQKEKAAAIFSKFFSTPKSKTSERSPLPKNTPENQDQRFMPFQIKEDMKLANILRRTFNPENMETLDAALYSGSNPDRDSLYLAELKKGTYKLGHSDNTWPSSACDDSVVEGEQGEVWVMEDIFTRTKNKKRLRWKLLQFHENRRPAYWGTWSKKTTIISGRKPFIQDKEVFDYDMDSDDEWEEEEPGESLHGSEEEKESEDDYEVDNEVFVPHGYLSDEEAHNEVHMSPDTQRLKLIHLEEEFIAERNEKTRKLKSKIYGCFWISNEVETTQEGDLIGSLLLNFRAVCNEDRIPIQIPVMLQAQNEKHTTSCETPLSSKPKTKGEFPESAIPDLIRLIHGHKRNSQYLAKEFKTSISNNPDYETVPSIAAVVRKIKELATWTQPEECPFKCWYVSNDTRNQYDLTDLKCEENAFVKDDKELNDICDRPKKSTPCITKFAKILTADSKPQQAGYDVKKNPDNQVHTDEIQEVKNATENTESPAVSSAKPKKYATLYSFIKRSSGEEIYKISSGRDARTESGRSNKCVITSVTEDDLADGGIEKLSDISETRIVLKSDTNLPKAAEVTSQDTKIPSEPLFSANNQKVVENIESPQKVECVEASRSSNAKSEPPTTPGPRRVTPILISSPKMKKPLT